MHLGLDRAFAAVLLGGSVAPPARVAPAARAPRPEATVTAAASYLADVPQGAPDVILGYAQSFRESDKPNKVNLVVGAYRDAEGQPWVLPSVREAESRLLARGEKKEYAPIDGLARYTQLALEFAYGASSAPLKEKRVAAMQTLSGTGACRIAGEFYARYLPKGTSIYVSDPTWGNHIPIFEESGLEVPRYPPRYPPRVAAQLRALPPPACRTSAVASTTAAL